MDEAQTQGMALTDPVSNQTEQAVKTEKVSTERMIPQSEVDKIVHGIKRDSYEKGQRDALIGEEAKRTQQIAPQPSSGSQSLGGMPAVTPEQIRQMIAEEAHKKALEEQTLRFANDFVERFENGKSKYDPQDFDKVRQKLNSMSHLVQLSGGIDNVADVYHHLVNNGMKLGNLSALYMTDPELARQELHKLSHSLKNNELAANIPLANEPLSQIKRSTAGVDNGKYTVSDLRKHPAFRV